MLVVGRGAGELTAYEERFMRRLKPFAGVDVIELPEGRGKQAAQRKQEEAQQILNRAGKGFVLFDERGKHLHSTDWAAYLERLPQNAQQDFVIGGADGVQDSVREAAGACWSLSALTLPHQLARVLVLEQLYRGFSILRGHPYHRV